MLQEVCDAAEYAAMYNREHEVNLRVPFLIPLCNILGSSLLVTSPAKSVILTGFS